MRKLLLALFTMFSFGCGADSIESLCDEAASEQCSRCYACAESADGFTGAELCQLTGADTTEETCTDRLSDRCEAQSSTLEEPKESIEVCVDSVADDTCTALTERLAQDRSRTVEACDYFL